MPQACNFIKRETLALVFSWEFCEISMNTFFSSYLRHYDALRPKIDVTHPLHFGSCFYLELSSYQQAQTYIDAWIHVYTH